MRGVVTLFEILNDKTICLTRGDIAKIVVSANLQDGKPYNFSPGDVVRFAVYKRLDCQCMVLKKDVTADAETESVVISLTMEDTKVGGVINKPVDYWYEIVINPDTDPQTIVGYDKLGAKIFRLYPEGSEAE